MKFPKRVFVYEGNGPQPFLIATRSEFEAADDEPKLVGIYELVKEISVKKVVSITEPTKRK